MITANSERKPQERPIETKEVKIQIGIGSMLVFA